MITELALRIVVSEGLEALTMPRLARDLDLAVGGLCRYFKSKEHLLGALQQQVITEFRADLETALAQASGALGTIRVAGLVRVLMVGWQYWTLRERAPAHFRLISLMMEDPRDLLPDDIAAPNVRWMVELVQLVVEQFEEATRNGFLAAGRAGQRVMLLWGSLHGVMQLGKLRRFEPDLFHTKDDFKHLMQALLMSWGARVGDVDESLEALERLVQSMRLETNLTPQLSLSELAERYRFTDPRVAELILQADLENQRQRK